MTKDCYVDMSHPMYGYNAQDKDSKIIIAINEEIRPCVRWKTNKQIDVPKGKNGFFFLEELYSCLNKHTSPGLYREIPQRNRCLQFYT